MEGSHCQDGRDGECGNRESPMELFAVIPLTGFAELDKEQLHWAKLNPGDGEVEVGLMY